MQIYIHQVYEYNFQWIFAYKLKTGHSSDVFERRKWKNYVTPTLGNAMEKRKGTAIDADSLDKSESNYTHKRRLVPNQ